MVVTDFDNAAKQVALSQGLKKALDFLRDKRDQELPNGRIDIDGDRIYALIQSYKSKMERHSPTFEAHRKYIDIQYIVSGAEILGWAPLDTATITVPYDEEKDVLLGTVAVDEWTPVRFTGGQVIVLYPTDAHAPSLAIDHPETIKKIVMKIALGS
jgi:biofilm protein TabA